MTDKDLSDGTKAKIQEAVLSALSDKDKECKIGSLTRLNVKVK
jgi:hypothetical protein